MIAAVAVLLVIGLASIHSCQKPQEFKKQLFAAGLGIIALAAVNLVSYRRLGEISYGLYAITLLGLMFVLAGKYLFATDLVKPIAGSYRWIQLHQYVKLQPSELAKLAYVLSLAWYLSHRRDYRQIKGLIGPFVMTAMPMFLIILEPDLGTVLLFLPVLFVMLFAAGARIRHLLAIIMVGIALSPVLYLTMHNYQKTRIKGLLYQNTDDPYWLRGPGYQLYQSKTCMGSGGLMGKGWGEGIYTRYRFLPDRHNDFIFAMIGHQWGFVGCAVVLGLYGLIIFAGLEIAANHPDPFGKLLVIGIAALLGAQMFINTGMTMGIMPVTGMTLPFISYGGTSLLCSFVALGLLVNVARHRPHRLARGEFEF